MKNKEENDALSHKIPTFAPRISKKHMEKSFKELLKVSFKSEDTEEWLDVHFTRPIGLVFALFWNKLGVHPNVITVLSIFLGAVGGWMFHYTDLYHNIWGVVLLMLANFCDSTDGQMARLTGKKTLLGRVLDGFASDVWFFCIYVGLVFRLWDQTIPGLDTQWGVWGFVLCYTAGFLSHAPQLFFLLGEEGSELNSYRQQRDIYESLPRKAWFARAYYYNYANYCRGQERRTPKFQLFFAKWQQQPDEAVRQELLAGSRPLMKFTNLLTHNLRAYTLFVTALLGCPWVYLLVEVIVMNLMYIYMHRTHETLCARLTERLVE